MWSPCGVRSPARGVDGRSAVESLVNFDQLCTGTSQVESGNALDVETLAARSHLVIGDISRT